MEHLAATTTLPPLTTEELHAVTIVFHQYETGLREGCIFTKDLLEALHSLGISPTEQEVVDMQCEMEKKGKIFFPDFCKLCQRKFREFDDEMFRQELFKVLCGTEPHPVRFRAKKYKVQEKSFSLSEFRNMMSHLPEPVSDTEIREMFNFADKNKDGRISWEEFLVMITPVRAQEVGTVQENVVVGKLVDTSDISDTGDNKEQLTVGENANQNMTAPEQEEPADNTNNNPIPLASNLD